jgi:hypothetical protein
MSERFTGHGPEWQDAKLTPVEAQIATSWVELKVDRRSSSTRCGNSSATARSSCIA